MKDRDSETHEELIQLDLESEGLRRGRQKLMHRFYSSEAGGSSIREDYLSIRGREGEIRYERQRLENRLFPGRYTLRRQADPEFERQRLRTLVRFLMIMAVVGAMMFWWWTKWRPTTEPEQSGAGVYDQAPVE